MRETIIVLWCDRHHADDGSKVEATERVEAAVDGQAVDLDLCASHAAEARGTFKAWLKIGRPAEAKRGPGARLGPRSPERTAKLARIRDWAETTGEKNSAGGPAWETPAGKGNYSRIEPRFDAWEAAHGQWDKDRWIAEHPLSRNGTAPAAV